jgi:ABC-type nickel/cobalt efflux system permease component RcnA
MVSFGLGVLHALEPGHGKSLLLGYWITHRAGPLATVKLAAAVTLSHATVLVALAMAAVVISAQIDQEDMEKWVMRVAALGLILTGLWMWRRARRLAKAGLSHQSDCECPLHSGQASNSIGAPSGRLLARAPNPRSPLKLSGDKGKQLVIKAASTEKSSPKIPLLLGVSLGLMPCPTALLSLSSGLVGGSAVSALMGVLSFSMGLFVSLALLGLVSQPLGRLLRSIQVAGLGSGRVPWSQVYSALLVVAGLVFLVYSGLSGGHHVH